MMATNPYDPNAGGSNPYLGAQANAITQQANQNLQLNQLPSIASGAVAAGGFGGSRQGVAEGVATGLTNQGLTNSLANLYGTQYQNDQQNQIARQQVANNYNLGLGQLGVTSQGQGYNFYTQNRQLDQSGAQLGANLYNQGIQGSLGQGQGIYNLGSTQQAAPWTATNNAGNIYSQFSGLGGGQTQTQNGSALGALAGGAILGQQLYSGISNLGLGTSNNAQTNPYTYSNFTPAGQGFQGDPNFYDGQP
jgi:uncharacterized membrane protein YebE (DUF533 family)